MRTLVLILLSSVASWGWSLDAVGDSFLETDSRYAELLAAPDTPGSPGSPFDLGFGERLSLGLHPFSGTGPWHFDGLASTPYYARYKDIEYGVRFGLAIALSESVHVGVQIPYTANPTSLTPDSVGQPSLRTGSGHLDAAFGLDWSF
jgi:hypothetical protein